MKKLILFLGLAPLALASLPAAAEKTLKTFTDGDIVTLRADTGNYMTRCRDCQGAPAPPDTVTVHVTDATIAAYARFRVENVGGGRIALRADTGNYVARCNNCIPNGTKTDFLTIHATHPPAPWAQFTPWDLGNGKVAFQADTGEYFGRCGGCSPTSGQPDTVAVHVTGDPLSSPWAQWTVTVTPAPGPAGADAAAAAPGPAPGPGPAPAAPAAPGPAPAAPAAPPPPPR